MNIKEISKEIYENNVAHGFWTTRECGVCSFVTERPFPECKACGGTGKIVIPQDRNVGEMLMLITSELAEALEAHRKGKHSENIKGLDSPHLVDGDVEAYFTEHVKDTFEDELADVAIRLFDVAYGLGIDLEAHIAAKHRYNKTRPYKHGKAY